jgi:hypothetical protein
VTENVKEGVQGLKSIRMPPGFDYIAGLKGLGSCNLWPGVELGEMLSPLAGPYLAVTSDILCDHSIAQMP